MAKEQFLPGMPCKLVRCKTTRCRNRFGSVVAKSPYCAKCKSRRFKHANPLGYYYNLLKQGARARGKEFTLTFEEYCEFALKTDYHKLRGKSKYSLSINRIDETKGYHKDNIEAITLQENSRLGQIAYAPKRVQAIWGWQNSPEMDERIRQQKLARQHVKKIRRG